ncbi:FG-GAP repeat domain-containing protein, partial [Plantactinospora solaniradicis]
DGRADVGVLYDYGASTSTLWMFRSTGTGFAAPEAWWRSGAGSWASSSSKLAVGDYTGDGRADVGVLYDYGASTSTLWMFRSTGTGFAAPEAWWRSGAGSWASSSSKLAVGDYTGDGRADVGVLYDYGASTSTLWMFRSTGTGFAAPEAWWRSAAGSWASPRSKLAVGDYTGDGRADVGVLYDYGASTSTLWMFRSTGTGFTAPEAWWRSAAGSWASPRSKLT